MIEQTLEIPLAGGTSTTFIVHPERDGPHPLILFLMDAPGIREELRDMARRLASAGYYVMLPNLYYRAGVLELVPAGGAMDDALRAQMMELMNGLTIPMVMDDVAALTAFAAGQAGADVSRIGTVGYCMSGQFAINAAVRLPQVKAAASIHGTYLVTDEDDSPHLAARKSSAELYFACAETDRWAPLETVEALAKALAADGARAEVEIYPGAEHGFTFPQRALYQKQGAERHWERLNALYRRNLG